MTDPLDADTRAEAGVARERDLAAHAKELAADRDRFRRLYADLVPEHEGLLGRAAELEAERDRLWRMLYRLVELKRTKEGLPGIGSHVVAATVEDWCRKEEPAAWAAAFAEVDGEATT